MLTGSVNQFRKVIVGLVCLYDIWVTTGKTQVAVNDLNDWRWNYLESSLLICVWRILLVPGISSWHKDFKIVRYGA